MTLLAAVAGSLANEPRIQLLGDICASHETAEPAVALASITFKRNGSIHDQDGEIGRWNVANIEVVGDRYEMKHTRSSGPTFSGSAAADDTFVALTADRTWFNTREVLGACQPSAFGRSGKWATQPVSARQAGLSRPSCLSDPSPFGA